jgi:hypothetical protein
MKAFHLLILFFILRDNSCLTLAERYAEKVKEINPVLHPVLDITSNTGSEEAENQLIESIINEVLMNNDPNRAFLWADLVKEATVYEFFFDRTWDPENSEDIVVQRKANKAFNQYREIGGDESKCRAISSKDMQTYERQFRNKLINFMASLGEYSQKSLLYQLLPNGVFRPSNPETFKVTHDIEKSAEVIFNRVVPFINCLQIHTEITVVDEPEGFFLRFWNWLRSLFGFKPKKPTISAEPDDVVLSEIKRQMQPNGSSLGSETFISKSEEFKALINSLAEQGARNLAAYRSNLAAVAKFMMDPMTQITKALDALLLRFRAEENYDFEAWKNAASPLLFYNIVLNCDENKASCRLRLRKDAKDSFDLQTETFVAAFKERDQVKKEQAQAYENFIVTCFGTYLEQLTTMSEDLAVRTLKTFWEAILGSSRPEPYKNSPIAARRLESMAPISHQGMSNGRIYALAYEILAFLPPNASLSVPNWFGIFVSMFSDFAAAFGVDVLKLAHHSKIMIGDPFGSDEVLHEYYATLSALVVRCLKESTELDAEYKDFAKHFDTFLDHYFKEGLEEVVANYPLLKVHNLWAVNESDLLSRTIILTSTPEQKALWSQRFLQTKKTPKIAKFLRDLAGSSLPHGSDDDVWDRLREVMNEDVQDLNPGISSLYDPYGTIQETQDIVQLI